MGKKVLMVVDVQRDTIKIMKGMDRVAEVTAQALDIARKQEMPVIFLCDSHRADDPEVLRVGMHCLEGTEGAQLAPNLERRDGDYIITKREQSGFSNPELLNSLKAIEAEEVWLAGDVCVGQNARDLAARGFKPKVIEDAMESPYGKDKLKKELEIFGIPTASLQSLQ